MLLWIACSLKFINCLFLEFLFNIFALQLTIYHWNCKKTKPWIGELGKTTVSQYMHIHGCECWEKYLKRYLPINCDYLLKRTGWGGWWSEREFSIIWIIWILQWQCKCYKESPACIFQGKDKIAGFPRQNFNYLLRVDCDRCCGMWNMNEPLDLSSKGFSSWQKDVRWTREKIL